MVVEYRYESDKGDLYRVHLRNGYDISAFFYVRNDLEIETEMGTRAGRDPQFIRTARLALNKHLLQLREEDREERGFAYRITVEEHDEDFVEFNAEDAAFWTGIDEVDVSIISW